MRPLLWVLLLCLAAPALADRPVAPSAIAGAVNVDAERVVVLVQTTPGLIVIDSRLPAEYAKGHIPGAYNLLDADMSEAALARLAPEHDIPLLFYCNGERCLRSGNAAQQALAWGYRTVYWFRGGWQEWLHKELPIER